MKKLFTLLTVCCTLLCCYTTATAQAPTPELLWYRFNETGTTVTNYASNAPSGTATASIVGGLTQGPTGQCGGALIGNGQSSTSNYVNTNWATDLNGTSWTLSFWTNNVPSTTTTAYILGDVNASGFRVFTGGVAGAGNWILRGGFTDVYINGGASTGPALSTFVYDMPNNEIRSYLNGVLVSTVAQAAVTISGTGPFKVGGYSTSASLTNGSFMDEFRLYSRALTVPEIQLLLIASDYTTSTDTACVSFTTAGGDVYTQSGVYNDTVVGASGCDSIITYNLTINNATTSSINPVVCDGNPYTSPAGNVYAATGTYFDTIPNVVGCDSIITINLVIALPTTGTITKTACQSYTSPSGQVFTASGTYNDTIANVQGCDSIITINLTITNNCDPAEALYYRFNESGTAVTNYADNPPANAGTATIMGGVTQNTGGLCGGALIGSGVSSSTDYLNTGWATNLSGSSFTVSFWTKDFGQTSTLYYIFGDATAGSFRCFTNGVAGANNWILRGSGITDVLINGGATVAPHMCTYVYDATLGDIKGYLDGVLVNTVIQATTPTISGTGPFKVMGYGSNVGAPAGGKMDEFRLYKRALSAAEVLALNDPNTYSSLTEVVCDSYTSPNGTVHTTSGIFNDTIANSNGCDSIITIDLTINNSTTAAITVTDCDSYTSDAGNTYTTSGVYTEQFTNAAGCDSTLTINLTINNSTTASITVTECDSYTSDAGSVYTTSGVYTEQFTNAAGCDSTLTINLTINNSSASSVTATECDSYTSDAGNIYTASGVYTEQFVNAAGCDSVLTLNLTILQSTSAAIIVTECDSYTSGAGNTYTTSGVYTETLTNAAGCDSTLTINLTINNSTTSTLNVNECDSYTSPAGNTYTTSGTYTDVITNAAGCDSTITINLTINNSTTSTLNVSECDSYTSPAGNTYTASGTYTDVITNAAGCDSTITINLTINQSTTSTLNVSECDSYTSPAGNTYTASGTYTDVITNAAGCDSTITINLTINNSTTSTLTVTECGSYTSPAGNTYTASGTYTDVVTNAAGCDSTITINLTINQSTASTLTATGCGSYISPAGNTYTASGTYTDTIANAAGCDSIVTIDLTVIPQLHSDTIMNVCEGTVIEFNGQQISAPGNYNDTIPGTGGCDSIITLHYQITDIDDSVYVVNNTATVIQNNAGYQWINCNGVAIQGADGQSFTPVLTGSYQCIIYKGSCTDTTACVTFTAIGNIEAEDMRVSLYPNPTSGLVTLKSEVTLVKATCKVTTLTGQVVMYVENVNGNTYNFDVANLAQGIYVIELTQAGTKWQTRLVKN